jgi:hypothetical protein
MKPILFTGAAALIMGTLVAPLPVQAALRVALPDSVLNASADGPDTFVLAKKEREKGEKDDRDDRDDRDRDERGRDRDDRGKDRKHDRGDKEHDRDDGKGHSKDRDGKVHKESDSDSSTGKGRRKQRVPGGSGCDSASDVLEYATCSG